ncbi:amidohydrolase family protein [Roseococcus pinisoli]|uniref:Amidohydrolase family protein n=1 Tax=Roseococcus pinisoli TaxID=2835040 RepID=A0ABS5QB76_9PROT|nr:amidohydrolase family protein [Roseococcus pinisoli]MBS7810949.1 amidohydrolase family protein [Roseococcus pinisoli]
MSDSATTAVFGSYVLAEEDGTPVVLRDHWVTIEGSRIAAVGRGRPRAGLVLDRPGRIVLPGLLNLHNHCYSEGIARTHTDDSEQSLDDLIYRVLMPLSLRGIEMLSAGERLAVARLGILQLIKGGSATVMEPFRDGIPEMFDAASEMGLRFYGAPYVYSDPHESSSDSYDRWNALHARWDGEDEGRIRVAMSPHATDTCGQDLLRLAVGRARELGTPITLHLAQSAQEVAAIAERASGRTPAEYLDWLGVLGPDLLAAHCVRCTDDDLDLMARRDVTVLNCPRTLARAGVPAPYARFASRGVRTVVATDGYDMDLLGELGAAAMLSKCLAGRSDVATAPELIRAVTRDAAAALNRPDLGRICAGAAADVTIVDLSHPHLQPLHDPLRALVALANRANIDGVMVAGRLLLNEGRLLAADEDDIVASGAAAIRRVWEHPESRSALRLDDLR